ncbi:MAG: hypothetical protein ACLRSW_16740 [Christensenellaceae bacterium]
MFGYRARSAWVFGALFHRLRGRRAGGVYPANTAELLLRRSVQTGRRKFLFRTWLVLPADGMYEGRSSSPNG